MTIEEILANRKICLEQKVYMPFYQHNIGIFKEFILTAIIAEKAETVYVFCSSEMKLTLLNDFWIEDFNYLGTRIKIIIDPAITKMENDNLLGRNKKILACSDIEGKLPIGFYEQII